jgi:competence/damage-inducible protein CinA-like protein
MFKVALLSIGDEVCIGQVVNSNTVWLARECTKIGTEVVTHSTIADDHNTIIHEIDRLMNMSDFVLVTGGLGPTPDDLTKPALLDYFNDQAVLHQPTLDYIKNWFDTRGITFSENNLSMALLPSKCKALPNSVGTAPGMLFKNNGSYLVSMPGVPSEMKAIVKDHLLGIICDLVKEKQEKVVAYKTIRTIGIPESHLDQMIGPYEDIEGLDGLAFLPSYKGVRLRLKSEGENFEEAEEKMTAAMKEILPKIENFVFGFDDTNIEDAVVGLMRENGLTLSVAESCTGGMIGAAITNVPGSSSVFQGGGILYSNESKINIMDVPEEVIIEHGAVSEESVKHLAKNARAKFATDYAISISGVAGPGGGTEVKPVGTVWIGLAREGKTMGKRYLFGNDRAVNRERAVGTALGMLYMDIKGLEL